MFTGIDLYSDTMTRPTAPMKHAMMDAPLGDEQQGEDPTTRKLEERMAKLLSKSAAMFFPSATLCNQIAIFLHARAGDEVLGAEQSHVFTSEGGGVAFHARAQARMMPTANGLFSGDDLKRYVRHASKPHVPKTALLVVENTMNGGGGSVWPLDALRDVTAYAKELGLMTHLDGARIFNAAVASKSTVAAIARSFDTVTVCFSKGLGCPTGAILAFDEADWTTVRRLKQVFGGAMRQSGILAAACIYALDHHVDQLAIDHAHATRLATLLSSCAALRVENSVPESNMVFFSLNEAIMSAAQFLDACTRRGLRFSLVGPNRFRAVTHRDISTAQIESAFAVVTDVLNH